MGKRHIGLAELRSATRVACVGRLNAAFGKVRVAVDGVPAEHGGTTAETGPPAPTWDATAESVLLDAVASEVDVETLAQAVYQRFRASLFEVLTFAADHRRDGVAGDRRDACTIFLKELAAEWARPVADRHDLAEERALAWTPSPGPDPVRAAVVRRFSGPGHFAWPTRPAKVRELACLSLLAGAFPTARVEQALERAALRGRGYPGPAEVLAWETRAVREVVRALRAENDTSLLGGAA